LVVPAWKNKAGVKLDGTTIPLLFVGGSVSGARHGLSGNKKGIEDRIK